MSRWGWSDSLGADPQDGGAPRWLRGLSAMAPWVAAALLFALVAMVGGTITSATGAAFTLPDEGVADVSETDAVALLMPSSQGSLVFFDDTRYAMDDEAQMDAFATQLKDRVAKSGSPTLLVLADRRVSGGDFMRLAAVAKASGVAKTLFAERKPQK